MKYLCLALTCFVFLIACSEGENLQTSETRFRNNIKILASDEFEGRKPATRGGRKTTQYIEAQFKLAGLRPGNGDSFRQAVDLVDINTEFSDISVAQAERSVPITHGNELVSYSRKPIQNVSVDHSNIVFVGYGVVAPEYDWNDYQTIDVKGKTVIMLSNDPGYLSPNKKHFLGKGITYYAKDTYKYEEAERQGAKAAFIIHDPRLMSSDWPSHVQEHNKTRSILTAAPVGGLAVQGYISAKYASELMTISGWDYMRETQHALSSAYIPKFLDASISIKLKSSLKHSTSHNIVGMIPGSESPDETVIYLAHWDHLGKDDNLKGDKIYNGARDNAAGIASIIELAHLFKATDNLKRSVVIMAVSAEESGLLGSYHYVQNPIFPLSKTVGAINLDMMNLNGETSDVLVHGINNSPLMDAAIKEAIENKQGRTATPFGRLEAGIAYRNDGFSFNRSGIPTIGLASGSNHIVKGQEWMDAQAGDYFQNRYHQVKDEYSENLDVSGALLDIKSLYLIGLELSKSKKFAQWYDGKEFKYLRDEQLKIFDTNN